MQVEKEIRILMKNLPKADSFDDGYDMLDIYVSQDKRFRVMFDPNSGKPIKCFWITGNGDNKIKQEAKITEIPTAYEMRVIKFFKDWLHIPNIGKGYMEKIVADNGKVFYSIEFEVEPKEFDRCWRELIQYFSSNYSDDFLKITDKTIVELVE